MVFNFRGLLRFIHGWFFKAEWTGRRALVFAAFVVVYPVLELLVWSGLFLDTILFRAFRRVEVKSPVFVAGNPRSGTTFLHRLLSRDEERFSTMRMWEVLFAPSITQRMVLRGIGAVLRWLRVPFSRPLDRMEERWRERNVMHHVSLSEPEEDDYLMLHIWSALTTGLSSGLLDEAIPYTYFDTKLPPKERRRIMSFYRACLQRHLHADRSFHAGGPRQYLAKNPALCPKLDSIFERFPDAKIVYLIRSPLEMIPSYLSMMRFSWRVVGVRDGDEALRDYLLAMARHWYRYPLERLAKAPENSYAIVRYDDAVSDPEGTVEGIYDRFGFALGPEFAGVLRQEAAKARRYRSRHEYDLGELGLDREELVAEYRDILDRFNFRDTPRGT